MQQLVRGTNEVLVNTVTSAPSSRKTSLDVTVVGNMTQSTNVSSENLNSSDAAPTERIDSDNADHAENPPAVKEPAEDTTDKIGCVATDLPRNVTDVQDPKDDVNNLKNVQLSSPVETMPLQPTLKKSNGKPRFFRYDSKVPKDATVPNELHSDDEVNDRRMGKSFREVKKMGIDLVEEVREKSREMRAWTASKLPQLQR